MFRRQKNRKFERIYGKFFLSFLFLEICKKKGIPNSFMWNISSSMILKENGTSEHLTEANYVKRQHLLMWIEEHQARKELQSFDKIGIPLQKTTSSKLYKIEVRIPSKSS